MSAVNQASILKVHSVLSDFWIWNCWTSISKSSHWTLFNPKSGHSESIRGRAVLPVAMKSSVLLSVSFLSQHHLVACWGATSLFRKQRLSMIQVVTIPQNKEFSSSSHWFWMWAGLLLAGKRDAKKQQQSSPCLVLHKTSKTLVLLCFSRAREHMKPPRAVQIAAKNCVKSPAGISVPIKMFTCLSNPRRFNSCRPDYCISKRDSLLIKPALSQRDYRLHHGQRGIFLSVWTCWMLRARRGEGGGGDLTPLKHRVASPRATNGFDFVCAAMQLNIDSFPSAD